MPEQVEPDCPPSPQARLRQSHAEPGQHGQAIRRLLVVLVLPIPLRSAAIVGITSTVGAPRTLR